MKIAWRDYRLPRCCAYCTAPAEGNYAIHRDDFGVGPEVDLCDKCGSQPTPTCREIWDHILYLEQQPGEWERRGIPRGEVQP